MKQHIIIESNKEQMKTAIDFADWIVKKGYKLNQMNYSNNGGIWFLSEESIGVTTYELYDQYVKEVLT